MNKLKYVLIQDGAPKNTSSFDSEWRPAKCISKIYWHIKIAILINKIRWKIYLFSFFIISHIKKLSIVYYYHWRCAHVIKGPRRPIFRAKLKLWIINIEFQEYESLLKMLSSIRILFQWVLNLNSFCIINKKIDCL